METKDRKIKRGRPPRHGGYSLLTRGEISNNRKYIRSYLGCVREGLIQDLGPKEEDLSMAQLVLIDRIITKLGVLRLIEEHVKENGVIKNDSLSPSLRESFIAFDNSVRLSLQALGIECKKAEEALDLGAYLEKKTRDNE